MPPINLFAATGDAVARIASADGQRFETQLSLSGSGAQCVAVDPADPQRVYVGTFDDGVYRTLDGGATWAQVGERHPAQARALGRDLAVAPGERARGRLRRDRAEQSLSLGGRRKWLAGDADADRVAERADLVLPAATLDQPRPLDRAAPRRSRRCSSSGSSSAA